MAAANRKTHAATQPRLVFAGAMVAFASAMAGAAEPVDFGREILPIFSNHCYHCHGPDEQERKAKLRLDTREGVLGAGKSGAIAVIPGRSTESELVLRITTPHEDEVMPPLEAKQKLSVRQIELLKRWVDEGAPWGSHWAYQPPRRVTLPAIRSGGAAIRNPIDNFVVARLEREGLKPAPEADRRTLVRRLSFDLLGLPPDGDIVRAFLADERPDADQRLVESLLASPHFGERWSRYWLDSARYADSGGYLNDTARPFAYLYRDWVINAINRDMPFDQFTVEQLAGDLLPNATLDQKIATGFHRNTLKNDEAGADREEDRCKVAVDRTATTGAVWLGLTVGCAECHTHKYDQITHREFYQLYAFFNNTSEKDLPAPQPAELDAYHRALKSWAAQGSEIEAPLTARLPTLLDTQLSAWERAAKLPVARWTVVQPEAVTFVTEDDETVLTAAKDHSVASTTGTLRSRFIVAAKLKQKAVSAFRVEALTDPGKPVGRSKAGDFALSEFSVLAKTGDGAQRKIELAAARADFSAKSGAASAAIDGMPNTGWSIGPEVKQPHVIVFELRTAEDFSEETTVYFELQHQAVGLMNRFRLAATSSASPVEASPLADELLAIFDTPPDRRSRGQQLALTRHFAGLHDDEAKQQIATLVAHEAKKPVHPKTVAATLVAEERKTHIHVRGDFMQKGDEVQPGILAALHAFKPRGGKADRLDLARWIVDPANPLTARVTVNRIWQSLFGRGLVATVEDFGTRGESPSHPELLDYLATEFVRLGWSRKAIIRLIVSSATYRQSSALRPELMDRDPLNTLLARQNRNRLEAEVIRDNFLAASGLLNARIGGPSIYPPLPAYVTAVGRDTSWPATTGADQYRRGLYIHLRRNIPYPMLLTFDAPDSTAACFQRERSNTPLQALTLLNDPVFFECSQTLGRKLSAGPGPVDAQLQRGFELCMGRPPTAAEMKSLQSLHRDQLALNHGDAGAALGAVARVIMNLDEFITRD